MRLVCCIENIIGICIKQKWHTQNQIFLLSDKAFHLHLTSTALRFKLYKSFKTCTDGGGGGGVQHIVASLKASTHFTQSPCHYSYIEHQEGMRSQITNTFQCDVGGSFAFRKRILM